MRFGFAPKLDSSAGGIAQYSQTVREHLEAIAARDGHDLVLLVESAREAAQAARVSSRPAIIVRRESKRARAKEAVKALLGEGTALALARRAAAAARASAAALRKRHSGAVVDNNRDVIDRDVIDRDVIDRDVAARVARANVAWVFYPYHSTLSYESGARFASAIHDLQHRLQPEFPEVSAGGLAEKNERLIQNIVRRAQLLVVDSEVGKEDVLSLYPSVAADAVMVLPYLPPPYLARAPVTAQAAGRPYFFYPAQFWPHKNHMRVVEAFAQLGRDDVDLVFCGSASDVLREQTLRAVKERARALHVDGRVRFLGYVDDDAMSGLYRGALALVMPTFFGPTNIPILEAWSLDCPVITSDIRGVRDQAGDAALLVDPKSVEAIADAMRRIAGDDALRARLRDSGARRLASYTPDDFRARLTTIVDRMR